MRKVLLCLGLIAAALFLFGCAKAAEETAENDGALAGEAITTISRGYITRSQLNSILEDYIRIDQLGRYAAGAINSNPEWSCADTCREYSTDGKGKCLAGFSYDGTNQVMKNVQSCNIKSVGENGLELVCLCLYN